MNFDSLTLPHTIPTFNNLENETFCKHFFGKGENAVDLNFLLFPQCFLPFKKKKKNQFFNNIYFVVCSCFEFGSLKFCRLVKS